MRRLIAHFAREPHGFEAAPADLAELTRRKREVLTAIAPRPVQHGDRRAPDLSVPTVKTHIGRLLAKLCARDRAQLVITAYETGLVRAS